MAATGRGGPRVLIAPVTVTPTKALSLSHVKGLLWVDTMYRATRQLTEVTYRYSHTTFNVTRQTAGFWEFLDRSIGDDIDVAGCTEEDIGRLYARFRAEPEPVSDEALLPYTRAVEQCGWVHPVSRRILQLWERHYAWLGLHDPGISRHQPPPMEFEAVVERLERDQLCLDMRRDGGPVFLDATAYGVPLRAITSAGGHPNYLACGLRELLPLAAEHDRVVLVHDRELTEDYILLQKVLTVLGANVDRICVDRVPIDGVVRSSRHGVEHRHTLTGVAELLGGEASDTAVRLGLRLYFIAVLGKGGAQSYREDLLLQYVARAENLLSRSEPDDAPGMTEYLRRHTGGRGHVDAYRLTSSLLGRRRLDAPVRALAASVYG